MDLFKWLRRRPKTRPSSRATLSIATGTPFPRRPSVALSVRDMRRIEGPTLPPNLGMLP